MLKYINGKSTDRKIFEYFCMYLYTDNLSDLRQTFRATFCYVDIQNFLLLFFIFIYLFTYVILKKTYTHKTSQLLKYQNLDSVDLKIRSFRKTLFRKYDPQNNIFSIING